MPAAEALAATLGQLIEAARRGDLPRLSALALELDRKLSALEAAPPPGNRLEELRGIALEAEAQLAAVIRGVTAARARLAEIRAVRSGAGIYGGDGQRRRLSLPGPDGRRI